MTVDEVAITDMGYSTDDREAFIRFEAETHREPAGKFDVQFAAVAGESGPEFAVLDRDGLLATAPPDEDTMQFLDAVIERRSYRANITYLGEDEYGEMVGMGGHPVELGDEDVEQMREIKEVLES